MKNIYNSISSTAYTLIRKYLDKMVASENLDIEETKKILKDLRLLILALFVAIKEPKYREKSLVLLTRLINIYKLDVLVDLLDSKEAKAYGITSLDISVKKRKEIIDFMFANMLDQKFYEGIILSIGFYLTPDILDTLEKYTRSENEVIRKEANSAINFIKRN